MYIGRCVYNTLNRFVRRIIKMRMRRDVLLILLGILLITFATLVPNIVRTNWDMPTWAVVFIAIMYVLAIVVLLLAIRYIFRGIQRIDTKEKHNNERKEAERDNKLLEAIKQSISQALESAIQKQTKAAIKQKRSKSKEDRG